MRVCVVARLDAGRLRAALDAHKGNVARAALALGISDGSVRKRMRELGIPVGRPGNPRKVDPAVILELRHGRGLTYGQIGLKLGCTAGYACNVVRNMKAKQA